MLLVYFLVILFLVPLLLAWRNARVYSYRKAVLRKISDLSNSEIDSGEYSSWRARYSRFDSVSYDRMLLCFWKKLSTFYAGEDFNIE